MSRSLDHHTSRSSMIPNLPLWWSNNSIKCSTYKPCHVSMSFCVGCGMVGNANGVPTTTWRSTWFLGKMGHHHCPQGTIAGKPNLKRKKEWFTLNETWARRTPHPNEENEIQQCCPLTCCTKIDTANTLARLNMFDFHWIRNTVPRNTRIARNIW